MDPLAIARYGLMAAERRLSASAERVSRMAADTAVDYGREAVEQIQARLQFSASLGAVRVSDQMLQALLRTQT